MLNLDTEHTLYLIWKASYFISNRNISARTVDFLVRMATTHEDPNQEKGNVLQHAANSVRGAASSKIIELYYNHTYKDIIFDTLNKVAKDKQFSVRVSILIHVANLMHLDEERTIALFLDLINEGEPEIFKYSFWSVQYLIEYDFDKLMPYLTKAVKIPGIEKNIATVLAVAWIKGKDKSYQLLQAVLKKSQEARSAAVEVAARNLFDEDEQTRIRCGHLYKRFLKETDKEIAHKYSVSFLHLDPVYFAKMLPLLKKYAISNIVKQTPHYFYEYLLNSVRLYPKPIIDLLASWKEYDKPDISEGGHYDSEPVKLIIGAYNSLRESESDRKYARKALKIFDSMLQDERFRSSANKVIEEIES